MPPSPVDGHLQAVLEQLLTVFQATLFKDKAIKSSLQSPVSLPQLRVDRDRFKQVMLNLLKNAGEAVDHGGHIQLIVRDGINSGGRHCIEVVVVDDGPGVPADEIEQLFRPQASRKGAGHAGLGLTIAANLVREWGGEISYRALQPGASFQVLVPRVVKVAPIAADTP